MLTISAKQLDALQEAAEARRKGVSLDRLELLFPEDAELLGRAGMDRVIQFGISRAAKHGFDTPRTLHKYIVLMFIFGSLFDEDPMLTWPAPGLAAGGDQDARIDKLATDGKAWLAPVAGPDGDRYRRALMRMRRLSFQDFQAEPEARASRLRAVLGQVYPEQNGALQDEQLANVLRHAEDKSLLHGLHPSYGPLMWVMLMIMIGGGFDRDPLHTWAAAALTDETIGSPLMRSRRLFDMAIGRLNAYIAANRGLEGSEP